MSFLSHNETLIRVVQSPPHLRDFATFRAESLRAPADIGGIRAAIGRETPAIFSKTCGITDDHAVEDDPRKMRPPGSPRMKSQSLVLADFMERVAAILRREEAHEETLLGLEDEDIGTKTENDPASSVEAALNLLGGRAAVERFFSFRGDAFFKAMLLDLALHVGRTLLVQNSFQEDTFPRNVSRVNTGAPPDDDHVSHGVRRAGAAEIPHETLTHRILVRGYDAQAGTTTIRAYGKLIYPVLDTLVDTALGGNSRNMLRGNASRPDVVFLQFEDWPVNETALPVGVDDVVLLRTEVGGRAEKPVFEGKGIDHDRGDDRSSKGASILEGEDDENLEQIGGVQQRGGSSYLLFHLQHCLPLVLSALYLSLLPQKVGGFVLPSPVAKTRLGLLNDVFLDPSAVFDIADRYVRPSTSVAQVFDFLTDAPLRFWHLLSLQQRLARSLGGAGGDHDVSSLKQGGDEMSIKRSSRRQRRLRRDRKMCAGGDTRSTTTAASSEDPCFAPRVKNVAASVAWVFPHFRSPASTASSSEEDGNLYIQHFSPLRGTPKIHFLLYANHALGFNEYGALKEVLASSPGVQFSLFGYLKGFHRSFILHGRAKSLVEKTAWTAHDIFSSDAPDLCNRGEFDCVGGGRNDLFHNWMRIYSGIQRGTSKALTLANVRVALEELSEVLYMNMEERASDTSDVVSYFCSMPEETLCALFYYE